MRTFYADLLITNDGAERTSARVAVDDNGVIKEISSGEKQEEDIYFPGVVIPGFVNAHCHLELSHLKEKINVLDGGMTGFIRQLISQRFLASQEAQVIAMKEADKEMEAGGIVAVGDISNFSASAAVKKESKIYYHTFIELLGLDASKAEEIVMNGIALLNEFRGGSHLSSSLSPHAPYSVVSELYREIFRIVHPNDPLTIHMQESEDEIRFCKDKSGPLADFFKSAGFDIEDFVAFGEVRPLKQLLPLFPRANRLQLVHNTFTVEEEMIAAIKRRPRLSWCICPSANLFITGKLPEVDALFRNAAHVTIGTDSLASNSKLSVLDELKLITKNFPSLPFQTLVRWATLNGAEFLGIESRFGKIKPGWKSGLVVLQGVNQEHPVFHEGVTAQRID